MVRALIQLTETRDQVTELIRQTIQMGMDQLELPVDDVETIVHCAYERTREHAHDPPHEVFKTHSL
jgi:hypothetical protein